LHHLQIQCRKAPLAGAFLCADRNRKNLLSPHNGGVAEPFSSAKEVVKSFFFAPGDISPDIIVEKPL